MPLIDIVIPDEVGDVEECVIVTWLKNEGDTVQQGDELLILQAEKVSFEVPAPAGGTLKTILAQQGQVVTRGQTLAQLDATVATPASAPDSVPTPLAETSSPPRELRASPAAKRLAREHGIDLSGVPASGTRITEKDVQAWLDAHQLSVQKEDPRPVRASPAAKRLAREHSINLADVPISGARVTEKDVQALLDAQPPTPDESPATQSELAGPETVPLAGMRAAIARRMHQSLQDMAQLTLHTEADVTELQAYRAFRKAEGVTYTDLLVRACALALARHPRLNARLDGDRIILLPDIHIGLAVALHEGLVVPVIRNANTQSVDQITRHRARLVDRARAGQLNADEMSGSTFTVTNLGMFDIDAFTPIVNPPEVAILGVGRIVEKVVIYEGKIAQRATMTLSLSFDHRLVDGAPAAAFLQSVKQTLEEPATL